VTVDPGTHAGPVATPAFDTDIAAVTPIAPVVPTRGAIGARSPIGLRGSSVEGGLLGQHIRHNLEVTIPHGAEQLERAGNLANFRLAAQARTGRYVAALDDAGMEFPFLDTDVYKWLEAVGWALVHTPDSDFAATADEMIGLVERAQRPDGYLNTFFQVARPDRIFADLKWGHELYTAGHLIQGAIAWQRALGDPRLLRVAERLADRIATELGPGQRELIEGHPEIEMALVELYRTTGAERHLELARVLVERRGHGLLGADRYGSRYWQDHEPVRTAATPTGHAVRQLYLDSGVVDVAVETGDRALLEAVIRRWEALVGSRMYLTGAVGSRHRDESIGDAFELPPDRAYAETCAAIASVMLAWRLLLATGESRFADVIERTLYNGVLPAIALDGRHFFYSNPLQRRSDMAIVDGGAAATRRQAWFPCACCPPNLMRLRATIPNLVATTSADGIQVHQFAAGSIAAAPAGEPVALSIATDYPWSGEVDLVVKETGMRPWTLAVRVPAWCRDTTASIAPFDGGEPEPWARASAGYVAASRTWRPGDRLRIRLAMPPRTTIPDPRIDAVRGTLAIERGPLVYAIEEADLPDGTPLESLEVDRDISPAVHSGPVDPPLDGLTLLDVAATVRDDTPVGAWPYGAPVERTTAGERIMVRAVPYLAWGNRTGLGMRVWLPIRTRAGEGE
jgi:hypothetical protein